MRVVEGQVVDSTIQHQFANAGPENVEVSLRASGWEMTISCLTKNEVLLIGEYLKQLGVK
jgi:hypothetical protein